MTIQEIRQAYLSANNMTAEDLTSHDAEVMYQTWLEQNPRKIPNLDDVKGNIELGIWELKSEQATCYFSDLPFNMDISSCRWSLEQAIINRPAGVGIRKAVLDKVDEIICKAEEEISDN